jgi:hypothetical protein
MDERIKLSVPGVVLMANREHVLMLEQGGIDASNIVAKAVERRDRFVDLHIESSSVFEEEGCRQTLSRRQPERRALSALRPVTPMHAPSFTTVECSIPGYKAGSHASPCGNAVRSRFSRPERWPALHAD